jgi:aconitate hydratase
MGVLPLQFAPGTSRESLGLSGRERFTIPGLQAGLKPGQILEVEARGDGAPQRFRVHARLDNETDVEYLRNGGILPMVLRHLLA